MKKLMLILTLAAGLLLLIAALGTVYAQDGQGEGDEFAAVRGAAVYAEFCQACHGPQGESIGTAFQAITYDAATARDVIETLHQPPYGKLLSAAQIDEVIAYLATWESGEVPPLPEPNIQDVPESVPDYGGDPRAGAVVYAKFCEGCHGQDGAGRDQAGFPAFKFTSKTAQFVSEKHAPAFGQAAGGPLTDEQITDLETYMASWKTETQKKPRSEGINVLIVVAGALAIVAIGGAYLSRIVMTEQA